MVARRNGCQGVGLDATFLRPDRLTGVERYIVEIIRNVVALAPPGRFAIYSRASCAHYFSEVGVRARLFTTRSDVRPYVDQMWLPRIVHESGVGLVHYMTLAPPWISNRPFLQTIYDLTLWRLPDSVSFGGRYYYRPLLANALRSRDLRGIVTISRSMAVELRQFVNRSVPIRTVPAAPAQHFRPVHGQSALEVERSYGIQRPYLLAVGTVEPRKNLAGLLAAYERLIARIQAPPQLVIVGRTGWGRNVTVPPNLEHLVRRLHDVTDSNLAALYSGAALFALASFYEGFGLPVIEAMACGTPCVISDIASLRELGGESCLYADPNDAKQFADALNVVLENPSLAQRLSRDGIQRAQLYSWAKSAEQLLSVFDELGLLTGL